MFLKKWRKYLLFLAGTGLLLSLTGGECLSQERSAGILGATVDSGGNPVARTRVSVTNESTGLERQTTADTTGHFAIPLLPPGTYTLAAQKSGFPRVRMIGLTVQPGTNLRVTVQFPQALTLRGRVVDFKTGEAIAKALISIREQELEAVTDDAGRFEFAAVQPGDLEIYVSTVGYGLLKTRYHLQSGPVSEVEFQLGQEALKRSDEVTVVSGPFEQVEPTAATEHTLQPSDLKNLSSMFGDPFRSIHSLPGVSASDDNYSHFAYRGAGIQNIAFYIDGVRQRVPFHEARQLTELGSTSLLNGDVIESISLLGDGFPAKYGDSTAAVVNVQTREPGREKTSMRLTADVFQAGATAEGPIGTAKNASWMLAVRKSYLQYLMQRLHSTGISLGYYDTEGKVSWNPAPNHRLTLLTIHGPGDVRNTYFHPGGTLHGRTQASVANMSWQWNLPAAVLRTSAYYTRETAENDIRSSILLRSSVEESGVRHDATIQFGPHFSADAGGQAWRTRQNYLSHYWWDVAAAGPVATLLPVAAFNEWTRHVGAYIQPSVTDSKRKFLLSGGIRYEDFEYTRQNLMLPRAALSLRVHPKVRIHAGYGQYAQFPELVQLLGDYSNPALRAERATHYTAGVEYQISDRTRFTIQAYDREEKEKPFSPDTEWRLVNGQVTPPAPGPVLRNSLRGYSRGVELLLQRVSANRLSGWISYTHGYARYRDTLTNLRFDGDYDQRHIATAFASYRLSQTINLSGKFRYESNFPVTGFFAGNPESETNQFQFSSLRNQMRIPPYTRLDFRMTKACYYARSKSTFWVELDNLTNHANWAYFGVRQYTPETGIMTLRRDKMLPVMPTAGFTVEF